MTDRQEPNLELPKLCPKCGSRTIFGFGLAGGGVGPYVMCDGPLGQGECDFFLKKSTSKERQP